MANPSPIVGLGTLQALKASLLPGNMAEGTEYDSQLTAIGKSVAGLFNRLTNRTLARVVGGQVEFGGERTYICVPAYPVEAVSAVAMCYYGQPDFTDLSADVWRIVDRASGIVDLSYPQGTELDRIRITYTGGFWIPGTPNAEGTDVAPIPAGATALPDELFGAWTLQCATEMKTRGVLQTLAIQSQGQTLEELSKVSTRVTVQPQIEAVLQAFIRYA